MGMFYKSGIYEDYLKYFNKRQNSDRSFANILSDTMGEINNLKGMIADLMLENEKLKSRTFEIGTKLDNQPSRKGRPALTDVEKEQKAVERAEIQTIYKINLDYLEATIDQEKEKCDLFVRMPEVKKRFDYLKKRQQIKAEKFAYAQITIRPDSKKCSSLDDLIKKVDKYVKKEWMTEVYW